MCSACLRLSCISRYSLLPSVEEIRPRNLTPCDHDFCKFLWVYTTSLLFSAFSPPPLSLSCPFPSLSLFSPSLVYGEAFGEFLPEESASDGSNFSSRSQNSYHKMTYYTSNLALRKRQHLRRAHRTQTFRWRKLQNAGRSRRVISTHTTFAMGARNLNLRRSRRLCYTAVIVLSPHQCDIRNMTSRQEYMTSW